MDKQKAFLDAMGDHLSRIEKKTGRLYFQVDPDRLHEVVTHLFKTMGCRLSTATATETYRHVEVLYHFSDDETGDYYCPRIVMTDKSHPTMPSITPIVQGAEWIEREMYDFWGITFKGHPHLEPLLSRNHPKGLGHPLRFGRSS
jgi:NADH-quinone oxidoreductase subunit C